MARHFAAFAGKAEAALLCFLVILGGQGSGGLTADLTEYTDSLMDLGAMAVDPGLGLTTKNTKCTT
jgi:hypothetical protein